MRLQTKSVQAPIDDKDGIRICIMRRIKPTFEFDMWLPALSPSTELLKDYHDGVVDWEAFEKRLSEEVLRSDNKYIEIIGDIAKKYDVTLLCWEETPEKCHRKLVAQYIKKLNPTLKLFLK